MPPLELAYLYFCDLVLPKPKLLYRSQGLQILNILFTSYISTTAIFTQTGAEVNQTYTYSVCRQL